jgi:hypothetical protein
MSIKQRIPKGGFMSSIDANELLSETTTEQDDSDDLKLVPVAESIRYRKRAQSAEKRTEVLSEQLAAANQKVSELSEQLNSLQTEQKLTRKLTAAGAVDLETAVLIAKARLQGNAQANVDEVVNQLKKEKQYLFDGAGETVTPIKTAGAKERTSHGQAVLEGAAKKAARSGNRADLQEYLKLRRNFL